MPNVLIMEVFLYFIDFFLVIILRMQVSRGFAFCLVSVCVCVCICMPSRIIANWERKEKRFAVSMHGNGHCVL